MSNLDQCLDDNIFKPHCEEWANLHTVQANALRRGHCTADNMLKPECREWVKSAPSQNRAAMTYFCHQQPFDEMCIGSEEFDEVDQNKSENGSWKLFIVLIFIIAIFVGKCLDIYYSTKSHLKLS